MAAEVQHLERLVRELAALGPEERDHVVAEAARRGSRQPGKARFTVPTLSGGEAWVGDDLRREELYGEDGR